MLEIRNFKWLNPFRTLYDLKDIETEKWVLQQVVVPTLSLDEQPVPNHKTYSLNLTGTADTFVPAMSPDYNEVIRVTGYVRGSTTANGNVAISDGTNSIIVSTAGTTAATKDNINVLLRKGWSFGMLATGNGADSAITFAVRAEILTQKLERGSSVAYPGDLEGGVF